MCLLAVLGAGLLLGLRRIHGPDLGFHLHVGEWILSNARVPDREIFAYTVPGARYIDLYWLYQVMAALLDRAGGPVLLVAVNAVLIVAALALASARAWSVVPNARALVPPLLLLGVAGMTYDVRPHVVSWVFLCLFLLILERRWRGAPAPLWVLPVLTLVWINVHPLAVLGLVAQVVFLAGGALERRSFDARLLRAALFSAAAFAGTPYLFGGLAVPLTQLGFLQADSPFKDAIGEYVSPFSLEGYRRGGGPFFLQSIFPLHVAAALAVAAGTAAVVRRAWTDALLIGVFLGVFALAVKNFEYFFLATFPAVVRHLRPHTLRAGGRASSRPSEEQAAAPRLSVALAGGAALLAVLMQFAAVGDGWYRLWNAPFRSGLTLDSLHVPIRAAEFLRRNDLKGRIINDISSGGWLMRLWGGEVFVDGRNEVFGDRFMRSVLRTYTDPRGLDALIAMHRPVMAVFDFMKSPQWLAYFTGRREWRPVFADDHTMVWLRSGYAGHVPPASAPATFDSTIVPPPVLEAIAKQYPHGLRGATQWLLGRGYYPWSESQSSMIAYQMGWLEPAERVALEGLRRATSPSSALLFNLASILDERGRREEARAAYSRFLELDDDPVARRRLAELTSP
jgi:tetratricopeptide (TPR) repeat protein